MKESDADLENKFVPAGLKKKRPKRELTNRTLVIFGVLGLLVVMGFLGALTYYSGNKPQVSTRNLAIETTQRALRLRFGPGVVLNFSGPEWTHIETLPGNKYYVSGWVNAVTDRQRVSYAYTCTIAGGTWTVESISVLPQ